MKYERKMTLTILGPGLDAWKALTHCKHVSAQVALEEKMPELDGKFQPKPPLRTYPDAIKFFKQTKDGIEEIKAYKMVGAVVHINPEYRKASFSLEVRRKAGVKDDFVHTLDGNKVEILINGDTDDWEIGCHQVV